MKDAIIFGLLLLGISVNGQEFNCITKEDGLSSNRIEAIAQDTLCRIWAGGADGLNCYDGLKIKNYFHHPKDTTSLSGYWVRCIILSSSGELYIGTEQGLSIYNSEQDNFSNYYVPANDSITKNLINCIAEDKNGKIWVSTTCGLYKFNKKLKLLEEHFVFDFFFNLNTSNKLALKKEGLPENVMQKLESIQATFFADQYEFSAKLLLILGQFDYNKFSKIIFANIHKKEELFHPTSISTFIFEKDEIWLGFSNGNVVRTGINDSSYSIVDIQENYGIESIITSLLIHNEKLWIGSVLGGKILDFKKKEIMNLKEFGLETIFNAGSVRFKLVEDENIWISTQKGLYLFNSTDGVKKTFRSDRYNKNSIASDNIFNIFIDRRNELWVATDCGLSKQKSSKQFINISRKDPKSVDMTDNEVTATMIDSNGNTWVGYLTGGIDVYNQDYIKIESYLPNKDKAGSIGSGMVSDIVHDKKGRIWISTFSGGLQYLDPQKKEFAQYTFKHSRSCNSGQSKVQGITVDSLNNKWVNVLGEGFFKINLEKNIEKHFSKKDSSYKVGLSTNWVKHIYCDRDNQIYLVIGNNIYLIDEENKSINAMYPGDAPFDNMVVCIYVDSKKNLWVGTANGLFLTKKRGEPSNDVNQSKVILSGYYISGMLEDEQNNLWVSTGKGLCKIEINPKGKNDFRLQLFDTNDGLPSNTFYGCSDFNKSNGVLLFGSRNGFTYFNPGMIERNCLIPRVILTDLKLYNKSVKPGIDSYLKKSIVHTKKIVLPYYENFMSFHFAALDYSNPERNQYAYKMEGIDEDWVYIGNKHDANYTDLSPGSYTFLVKASNNDNVWNNDGIKLQVIITPPIWRTKIAYASYIIVFIIMLMVFRYSIRKKEQKRAMIRAEILNKEKANELNLKKLRFFTNVSHEFRTPLTLILSPLESLLKNNGNSGKLKLIYKNARKLLNLTEQILDIRKIEEGEMKLVRKKDDIVRFTKECVENFKFQAKSNNISLNFNSKIEMFNTSFDKTKIDIVLSNLIANAIKYTKNEGRIDVALKVLSSETNNLSQKTEKYISISVCDNGVGIPQEEQNKVFDRFYQSGKNISSGIGIGLALVKELVELHNGEINIKSRIGEGTEFVVNLPVISCVEDEEENIDYNKEQTFQLDSYIDKAETFLTKSRQGENMNLPLVMLVEDNDDIRNYLPLELNDICRTIIAKNGIEAMELLAKQIPEIIISDIMMPEMDGIELCEKIKNDQRIKHIPVLFLTAYHNDDIKLKGYNVGANDFIFKPFSPAIIKTKIRNILESHERLKERYSNVLHSLPTRSSSSNEETELVEKAITIIQNHISEQDYTIEAFCEEMGNSRTVLYSKIKEFTNLSISEFIKLIKLKKAIELFNEGNNSVSEVAFSVGFKTLPHFSRCFSIEFGLTPSEYLTQLKKNKAA